LISVGLFEINTENFRSQIRFHSAGAGEGTRTLNLRITNPMLYQLSYAS
jgi:hypothetical protein